MFRRRQRVWLIIACGTCDVAVKESGDIGWDKIGAWRP